MLAILQSFILIGGVYLAPALAVRPKSILNPVELSFIPIFSLFLIFVAQSILSLLNVYDPLVVQILTGAVFFIAAIRLHRVLHDPSETNHWGQSAKTIFLVCLALSIYIAGRLLEHGFDKNDEIYSWNMWAIQHYLGESVDYFYTQAPYPQFFPKILSYCYMVLGGIEHQAAVKTSLAILPLALFNLVGHAANTSDRRYLALLFVIAIYLLFALDFRSIFEVGMPDSLMAVAVTASVFYFLKYSQERPNALYLHYSVVCALVGLLSKQPGLLWGLFSLPALMLLGAIQKKFSWKQAGYSLLPLVSGAAWLLTEGQNFHENTGVTSRSLEDRSFAEQVLYSSKEWLLGEPALLLFLVLTVFVCFRKRQGVSIFVLFVVPSVVTWLIYAAYDLRAGVGALSVAALLIAYGNYGFGKREQSIASASSNTKMVSLLSALYVLCIGAAVAGIVGQKKNQDAYQIGNSDLNNLLMLFGEDAPDIYSRISTQEDTTLWAPTNYVYGVFYGRVHVIRPAYHSGYDAKALLEDLRTFEPDFVTDSGRVPFGPGGKALNMLVNTACPGLFNHIAGPDNKLQISFYEVNKGLLHGDACNL